MDSTTSATIIQSTSLALSVESLTKRFGGLTAVDSIDLDIPTGTIQGVIGPNGAGKTTFFNMIAGVYDPTEGRISFQGRVIHEGGGGSARPDQVAEYGIARTFQNIRLFANMTALENVLIGMHTRLHASPLGALLKLRSVKEEERQARAQAIGWMAYVGLAGKETEFAKNLSYGDQRRLEIGRALAGRPKLLLLDEPTAGMNPQETAEMTRFIKKMREDLDVTVLLIEHDMRVVMGISDNIAVLDYGKKIAQGDPESIQKDPRVIEAYLGKQGAEDAASGVESASQANDAAVLAEDSN